MVAVKVRSWEEIPDVLKSEVTASRLARFMVSAPEFNDKQFFLIKRVVSLVPL